ncbi:hypothetical protein niasHT_039300 [Heterodera trifolii]|uniref:EGF-like domain-containing protein n=1 Tax=Heterodera trifolii TaxID=157864 RepID=A0ABD2IW78_9BILA
MPLLPLLLVLLLLLHSLVPPGDAFALLHFRVALSSSSPLSDPIQIDFCLSSRPFNSSNECQLGHAQILFTSVEEKSLSFEFAHFSKQHFEFNIKVLRLRKNMSSAEENGDKEVLFRCSENVRRSIGLFSWQFFGATCQNGEPLASRNFSLDIRYRMGCGANFFGPNCEFHCELNEWERRIGHFECAPEDGRKRCAKGWAGPNCDRFQMPRVDSSSSVPSASSSLCFCLNGGKCSSDGIFCLCPPGFNGAHCEKCVTNGRCKGFCQLPGGCACPEGKGGQFCEKDLEFCARHTPCQNGATCLNSPEGSYTCECPPGFGGRNCEKRLISCGERPCRNGGLCVSQLMSNSVVGFRCDCPRGFFGKFCQVRVRSGCVDLPCQNGGSCADSSPPPSSSPISFRHRRIPPFLCLCANGWTGQICDQPLENCRVNSCQNGASCLVDPNSSFGFVCRCPHGWRGILCGEKEEVDECRTTQCQNGGFCQKRTDGFHCVCRQGFWGANCQEKVEENEAGKVPTKEDLGRMGAEGGSKGQNCSSARPPAAFPSVSVPIALLLFFLFAFLFSLSAAFSASSAPSSASSPPTVPSISTISQPKNVFDHRSLFASSESADSETARYVCEPTFRIGPQSRRHLEERALSAMGERRAPPRTTADELGRQRPRESAIYEEIDFC